MGVFQQFCCFFCGDFVVFIYFLIIVSRRVVGVEIICNNVDKGMVYCFIYNVRKDSF